MKWLSAHSGRSERIHATACTLLEDPHTVDLHDVARQQPLTSGSIFVPRNHGETSAKQKCNEFSFFFAEQFTLVFILHFQFDIFSRFFFHMNSFFLSFLPSFECRLSLATSLI